MKTTSVPDLALDDFAVWEFFKFAGEFDPYGGSNIFLPDIFVAFDDSAYNIGFANAGISHQDN